MMSKRARALLVLLIVTIGFVMFARVTMEGADLLRIVSEVKLVYFLHQGVLVFLFYLVSGYLIHKVALVFGVRQTFSEWYGLSFVNGMSNYLLPFKTGTMIRAIYLRNKYSFLFSHLASTLVYSTYVSVMVTLSLGLMMVVGIECGAIPMPLAGDPRFEMTVDLLGLAVTVALVAGALLQIAVLKIDIPKPHDEAKWRRIRNIVHLFADGAKQIASQRGLLLAMVLASLAAFLIQTARLMVAYVAVGASPDFLSVVLVSVFFNLGFILAILPGNLGMQEFLITVTSVLIGVSLEQGLIAAGIIRISALIMVFGLGGFYYYYLGIRKYLFRKEEAAVSK